MQKLTQTDLGGPYVDATPKADAETEMDAGEGNLLIETVVQGSNTSPASIGTFVTTGTAAPATVDAADVSHISHWGSGSGTRPTVSKTAVGRYTLTFPSSFTNGLSESEAISFFEGVVRPRTGDASDDLYAEILTISSNVVTVKVESPKGTAADDGDSSSSDITIGWTLYR